MGSDNNYGEKQLTRFFNDEFEQVLTPKLQKFGFHISQREKSLCGKKFDLWFHMRYVGFVIIETEMVGWHDYYNLTKLEEIHILDWTSKRKKKFKVMMFQVFSPAYLKGKTRLDEKSYCVELGMKLKKEHRNFQYFPLDMTIDPKRFGKMVQHFQRNKYSAKQCYRKDIAREQKKLSKIVTGRVERFFAT